PGRGRRARHGGRAAQSDPRGVCRAAGRLIASGIFSHRQGNRIPMSHRTKDLPEKQGLAHAVRELRYHEASRQLLAVVLIGLFAVTARPTELAAAIGLPLAIIGTAVRLYASGFIMKNAELATTGPYAFVRHPLYTGNILLVIGFAIANAQWWPVPLSLAFFWFYYPTAIEYEDRKLHRLFG